MRGICACSLAAGTAVGSVLGHKWSQLIGPRYLRLAASGRTSALHRGGRNPREDPGTSLSVQLEALVQADACAQPSADFPASGRAEPGSRAHAHAPEACSLPVQGWPGTVRDWPGIGQLTDRITMSDREVLGELVPSCPYTGDLCQGCSWLTGWMSSSMMAARSGWPWSRTWSRWRSRVGLNSIVVWK